MAGSRSQIIFPVSRPIPAEVLAGFFLDLGDVRGRGPLDLVELRVVAPALEEHPSAQPARLLREPGGIEPGKDAHNRLLSQDLAFPQAILFMRDRAGCPPAPAPGRRMGCGYGRSETWRAFHACSVSRVRWWPDRSRPVKAATSARVQPRPQNLAAAAASSGSLRP